MKKVIMLVFLLITVTAGAQQVRYKILSDDPRNVKPFSLSLEPFYGDLSPLDIHLGWQVRADLLFMKRLEFRADYRMAYLDINGKNENSSGFQPKKGAKPAVYGEAGVSFFFVDKIKRTQTKLVLSSRTSGNYTYTKYIMIPANKRKMFGVRGGLYNYSVAAELSNKNRAFFTATAENGTTLNGGAPDNTISTYFTSAFYGGLHWKSIIDVVASTDYGTKKVGVMSDFYIDVMFSPIVNFSDISDGNNVYALDPDKDKVKRIGWRAGWQMRHPNKVWLAYKFEFGARPGFKSTDKVGLDSERIYMMFSLGMNIPMGKKKSSED